MLLPRSEGGASVRTELGDDPASRDLLKYPSSRYGIVETRQTSSLLFAGQEYVHERQKIRDLLPTLPAPSAGIPIAIEEGATPGGAYSLEELDGRNSS